MPVIGWAWPNPKSIPPSCQNLSLQQALNFLAEWKPDVMYLTTTDFVQHKYAPEQPEAQSFYEMFDRYLTQLDAMGAAIVRDR